MSEIPPSVEKIIHRIIINYISNPSLESSIIDLLTRVGVKPRPDTIIAYLYGTCVRAAVDLYTREKGKRPSDKELDIIIEFLKKNSKELEKAHYSRRIN